MTQKSHSSWVCVDSVKPPPMLIFKETQMIRLQKTGKCMNWQEGNDWMGWEYSQTLHWNGTQNIVLLLVLDSYQCHLMTLVVKDIQQLSVEVDQIPSGCTSLCQPVNARFNNALKTLVCKEWKEWMLDCGINVSVVKPYIYQLIVAWVIKACDSISMDIVQHSLRYWVYSWVY